MKSTVKGNKNKVT